MDGYRRWSWLLPGHEDDDADEIDQLAVWPTGSASPVASARPGQAKDDCASDTCCSFKPQDNLSAARSRHAASELASRWLEVSHVTWASAQVVTRPLWLCREATLALQCSCGSSRGPSWAAVQKLWPQTRPQDTPVQFSCPALLWLLERAAHELLPARHARRHSEVDRDLNWIRRLPGAVSEVA